MARRIHAKRRRQQRRQGTSPSPYAALGTKAFIPSLRPCRTRSPKRAISDEICAKVRHGKPSGLRTFPAFWRHPTGWRGGRGERCGGIAPPSRVRLHPFDVGLRTVGLQRRRRRCARHVVPRDTIARARRRASCRTSPVGTPSMAGAFLVIFICRFQEASPRVGAADPRYGHHMTRLVKRRRWRSNAPALSTTFAEAGKVADRHIPSRGIGMTHDTA